MTEYKLYLPEDNPNAKALLAYLKTLDFAKVSAPNDWYEDLSDENKEAINQGLTDLKNGNVHADEDVRMSVKERILKARKG